MNYNELINPVIFDMKPSGIRKFFDIASEMDNVLSLSIGEPDFDTPWHIRDMGIYSLEKGRTHYLANSGLYELRTEICRYLERRFSMFYDIPQVLVTIGGSEAVDLAIRTLTVPGDEVIIPEPCFVCYSPLCMVSGAVPVVLPTKADNYFKIDPDDLKAAVTPKTKILVLSYPNNPTGAIMTRKDLEAVADVIRDTDICILSDEIYAELTYGEEKHCSISTLPGMYDRTLLISGFSKTYAMTGWRIGYACGNATLIKMMTKLHQYSIMSVPTTSQYAAVEALRNGDDDIVEMRDEYNGRRKLITDGLNSLGLICFEPKGAFYAFPDISKTGLSSEKFCEKLLKEEHVAIVPGNAFGESGEGYARVSYAASIDSISKALERIGSFLRRRGI